MALKISTIPRFLLPKTSWKTAAPRPSPFAQRHLPRTQPSSAPPPRLLCLQAQSFRHSSLLPARHAFYVPLVDNRFSAFRAFSTTPSRPRDHHFDTLKFVQRLRDEGFSETQSRAMMTILSDVIEESIQNLTRTMVLREDADRSTYTQKVDFTKLRSELLAQDKSETSQTLAGYERLNNDIQKLSSRVRDEVGRAQASVKLDLNLEKGRVREEAKGQELKIKETETRIEEVAAGLRERVEGVKFSTLQWLM